MHSQNALILYENDVLLLGYCKTLKKLAISGRHAHQLRVDSAERMLQACFEKHPRLVSQVRMLKNLIQLNTRGVPATESVVDTGLSSDPHEESVANAFLLKKAYRQAAAIAHPDKGGNHDDFAAVSAAYRAKDMSSIIEFLMSRERPLLDQIAYWRSEIEKPEAAWEKFKATAEFSIVRFAMSGNMQRAEKMAQEVLQIMVVALQAQLTRFNFSKD